MPTRQDGVENLDKAYSDPSPREHEKRGWRTLKKRARKLVGVNFRQDFWDCTIDRRGPGDHLRKAKTTAIRILSPVSFLFEKWTTTWFLHDKRQSY